jgi:hypothetical protein
MPRISNRGGRGGRGGFKGRKATTDVTVVKKTGKFVKRGKSKPVKKVDADNTEKADSKVPTLDAATSDISDYFRKNATVEQHFEVQNKRRELYIATLIAFDHYSIDVLANSKSRALAAAFARHDRELVNFFMNHEKKNVGFADVLRAVTILDSGREKRSVEKKLERIQTKTASVIKAKNLGKMRNDINNLAKMAPANDFPGKFSFSGATTRLIKKWVRSISEKDLEFYAISLPTEPWRKLANLAHLNPTKDFPNAPWFLSFCYSKPGEAVGNAKVEKCRTISAENVNEILTEFDLPYSSVKAFAKNLTPASKKSLAEKQEKLDTLLWYYEDLKCAEVDEVIRARLERSETISLPYGKLMERLLLFKELKEKEIKTQHDLDSSLFSLIIPQAESQLQKFKSTIPGPVAILGDASSSMDVAIRTATIISSLLTAICSAKLTFFNHANFSVELNPKNVADVLQVAHTTKASGSTSPAASLVPYFDNKEVIKTFIIVTDEEENTDAKTKDGRSWRFLPLFQAYKKEVYPATLIFVSFLRTQHSEGQMYREMVRESVADVKQFKFNSQRPDLTKLDSILGEICSKSSVSFEGYVERVESEIKANGLDQVDENLEKMAL